MLRVTVVALPDGSVAVTVIFATADPPNEAPELDARRAFVDTARARN